MQEKSIIWLSILVALSGIIILYFFPPDFQEKTATITGMVVSSTTKNQITLISLKPDKPLTTVIYSERNLTKGTKIIAKGNLNNYKDKIEFVATQITETD